MLSKRCTYGLRAVLYLASAGEDRYISIREISDDLGISYAFLTKVLQQLTREGILCSLRGPQGGVLLARPADELTMKEIVLAIDGPDLFTQCVLGLPSCSNEHPCALHAVWADTRSSFQTTLEETPIADLVHGPVHRAVAGPRAMKKTSQQQKKTLE